MIYLFAGSDYLARHGAYEKFLKKLGKETELFSFNRENFDPRQLESLYSGAGLFFKKSATTLHQVLDNTEAAEFILARLFLLEKSQNIFIFLESKLPKAAIEAFKKVEAKINTFDKEKQEIKFNNFILANALGRKDKLNLWIAFRQALAAGASLEELSGVLFWKAKDMLLKNNFGKWERSEIKDFTGKLAYLLPEARREGREAEAAFEEFILTAL